MLHRPRHSHLVIPGRTANLMRTARIRPFSRGGSAFDSGVIENGGFETDDFWDFGLGPEGWIHDDVNEVATIETSTGGTDQLRYFPSPLEAGKTYEVTFQVLEWNGSGRIRVGGNGDSTDWFTGTGTSQDTIVVTGASLSIQAQINWEGVIDNVRIVEV